MQVTVGTQLSHQERRIHVSWACGLFPGCDSREEYRGRHYLAVLPVSSWQHQHTGSTGLHRLPEPWQRVEEGPGTLLSSCLLQQNTGAFLASFLLPWAHLTPTDLCHSCSLYTQHFVTTPEVKNQLDMAGPISRASQGGGTWHPRGLLGPGTHPWLAEVFGHAQGGRGGGG